MRRALLVTLSFVGASFHTAALAQSAITTGSVNVRAGPDRFFPTVTWVLGGTPAKVNGCVESWRWCDVEVAGKRGWIYARYLSVAHDGRKVTIAQGGPTLGITPVGFALRDYWEAQYKDRRWFAQAAHYQERWERRRPQPAWKAPTSRG
jgi:uncharacterized protein YraI